MFTMNPRDVEAVRNGCTEVYLNQGKVMERFIMMSARNVKNIQAWKCFAIRAYCAGLKYIAQRANNMAYGLN